MSSPHGMPGKDVVAAKAVVAALAFVFVLAGLALFLVQERIGLDEDTGRLVSTALQAAAPPHLWDQARGLPGAPRRGPGSSPLSR